MKKEPILSPEPTTARAAVGRSAVLQAIPMFHSLAVAAEFQRSTTMISRWFVFAILLMSPVWGQDSGSVPKTFHALMNSHDLQVFTKLSREDVPASDDELFSVSRVALMFLQPHGPYEEDIPLSVVLAADPPPKERHVHVYYDGRNGANGYIFVYSDTGYFIRLELLHGE